MMRGEMWRECIIGGRNNKPRRAGGLSMPEERPTISISTDCDVETSGDGDLTLLQQRRHSKGVWDNVLYRL
jgi:hypothetical protein